MGEEEHEWERAELAPLCGVNLHASDGRCDLKGVLEVHTEIGAACFGCCETGDGGEMRERGGSRKEWGAEGSSNEWEKCVRAYPWKD